MSYVHVTDDSTAEVGALPLSARRLDTGERVYPPVVNGRPLWTPELARACGYHEVVTTTRPDDSFAVRYEREVRDEDGAYVERWTPLPTTKDEQARWLAAADRAEQIHTARRVRARIANIEANARAASTGGMRNSPQAAAFDGLADLAAAVAVVLDHLGIEAAPDA